MWATWIAWAALAVLGVFAAVFGAVFYIGMAVVNRHEDGTLR